MLVAYLPRERLLIEVDAFSPGGTYHPYAANLLEQVQRRKLRVDRDHPAPRHDPAVQRPRSRGQAGRVTRLTANGPGLAAVGRGRVGAAPVRLVAMTKTTVGCRLW